MQHVAYQGAPGAYSEEAVVRLWPDAVPVPMRECIDVARAVERGDVAAGLLAVENTLAGSVVASYDALAACDTIVAVGEIVIPIHHCVLGIPGASLETLRWVESHPVALAQCTGFFDAIRTSSRARRMTRPGRPWMSRRREIRDGVRSRAASPRRTMASRSSRPMSKTEPTIRRDSSRSRAALSG